MRSRHSNPDETGREPSLGSGMRPTLTGLEPALGTSQALRSRTQIRLAGIQARLGSRQGLTALIATLRSASSYRRRIEAAQALSRVNAIEAEEAIASLTDDPESLVRRACATELGRIGSERVLAPLTKLLEDRNADVRESAVRAITNVALKNEANEAVVRRVVRELIVRLNDSSVVTQEVAAVMLGWIGGSQAAVALQHAQSSNHGFVARAAHVAEQWATDNASTIGAYRRKYQNPIVAGWMLAKEILPPISIWSTLLTLLVFVSALIIFVWGGSSADMGPIVSAFFIVSILFMPFTAFGIARKLASDYRRQQVIQMLKLAPVSKTVMQWGYTLASLYRIRLLLLVTWACVIHQVIPQPLGFGSEAAVVGLAAALLYLFGAVFSAHLGTSMAINSDRLHVIPLTLLMIAVPGPCLLIVFIVILADSNLILWQRAVCSLGVITVLVLALSVILYRMRYEA